MEVQWTLPISDSTARKGLRKTDTRTYNVANSTGKQVAPTAGEDHPPAAKQRATSRDRSSHSDVNFMWKRTTAKPAIDIVKYNYGQVNLKLDDSEDVEPVTVFEQVSDFGNLLSLIVEQSELYMKQKGIPFATNEDELRAFFGICLVMGYHVLPSIRDYFNRCFQAARSASKQQSIDEHMIKFKGHNIMKRYIRNKPVKWGFKLWCRCDAVSGYLYQFDLYTGRKTATEYGLGEGVVIMLTTPLEELGCQIFTDNFFNSPLLQIKMFEKKIYLCGTVRADRKHMPKNLKSDKEMKRGDTDAMTANGVTCVKWMDNRSVQLLSNFLPWSKDDVTHVLRRQAGSS